MKQKITSSITLLLMTVFATAQVPTQYISGDSVIAGAGCSQGFYIDYSYKPQDIASFEFLRLDYAKDKHHVYFEGKTLPFLNSATTRIIYPTDSSGKQTYLGNYSFFLTDGVTTYFDDIQVENIDIKDIRFFADTRIPLFISNNNAYFKGHLLRHLDVSKLRIKDPRPNENVNYFTDSTHIYQNEVWIEGADANTFRRNSYYVNGKEIADANDKHNFYYKGKKAKPYPDWTSEPMFADSFYTNQYIVQFISAYETQDTSMKPTVDFYLSHKDWLALTRNIKLQRKTTSQLDQRAYLKKTKAIV